MIAKLIKICDICNKPIKHAKTSWAARCQLPEGESGRSTCQRTKDRQTSKAARDKIREAGGKVCYRNQAFDDKSQEAMRECLKCDVNADGVAPKFLSRSPYHRICDSCSNTIPGINMKNLSGLARTLPNLEHITIV